MIIETQETFTTSNEPIQVRYEKRSIQSRMGRFGGGWNYLTGMTVSDNTIILRFETFSIDIRRNSRIYELKMDRQFEVDGQLIKLKLNLKLNSFRKQAEGKGFSFTKSAKGGDILFTGFFGSIEIVNL